MLRSWSCKTETVKNSKGLQKGWYTVYILLDQLQGIVQNPFLLMKYIVKMKFYMGLYDLRAQSLIQSMAVTGVDVHAHLGHAHM